MERRLSQVRKSLFFSLIFLTSLLAAQTPSVVRNIRIPLWAEIDAYPELEDAQNLEAEEYSYPIKSLKELAPFIITGMVYGWNFVYTPSDKLRNVEEYLEITEIFPSENLKNEITYDSPWLENSRLNCWCLYQRNDVQVQNYYLWSSIQNPVIHGRGKGNLEDGFEGIRNAAYDALKNAVRSHYRNVIKNKPKQITGSVLISSSPTLGIDAGKYVINLDFFLEYDKIIQYKVY